MSGKPFPVFQTDEEAERFVADADLTEYDFSGFKPGRLVFRGRREEVTVSLPEGDRARAEAHAEAEGVPLDHLLGRVVHDWLERKAS